MAHKLTINPAPGVKSPRSPKNQAKLSRLPLALAMMAAGFATLAFSFTQVARVSPKRGNVVGIVKDLQSDKPKGASPLPPGIDPTRGTKLWVKKGDRG